MMFLCDLTSFYIFGDTGLGINGLPFGGKGSILVIGIMDDVGGGEWWGLTSTVTSFMYCSYASLLDLGNW